VLTLAPVQRGITASRKPLLCGLLTFALCSVGCAPAGPSYAELVTIYNTELEVLERFERQREELVAKYEAATQPQSTDTLEALQGVLESATKALSDSAATVDLADPEALLEKVSGEQGAAKELAGELRGAVTGQPVEKELTAEEAQQRDNLKQEFEEKLAKLDAEIAAQKERVDKARAARDSAE